MHCKSLLPPLSEKHLHTSSGGLEPPVGRVWRGLVGVGNGTGDATGEVGKDKKADDQGEKISKESKERGGDRVMMMEVDSKVGERKEKAMEGQPDTKAEGEAPKQDEEVEEKEWIKDMSWDPFHVGCWEIVQARDEKEIMVGS